MLVSPIIWEIKEYLKDHPKASLVNLGCGLDETGKTCDNGLCNIVNIDFPDVISIRKQLISEHEREKNIACDLKDYSWINEIDGSNDVIFFAAGVFHYFKTKEVKTLVLKLSREYLCKKPPPTIFSKIYHITQCTYEK